jgi:hypothetical protein
MLALVNSGGLFMRRLAATTFAAIAVAGLATAADARRVTVDTGIEPVLGGCTLDFGSYVAELCQTVDLGFTVDIEEADGSVFSYNNLVLYDEGFISFGGEVFSFDPFDVASAGLPLIVARFEPVDTAPFGQFVSAPSEVIRGDGTFRAYWYDANLIWTWTEFDEDGNGCCNGFLTTLRKGAHARLHIQSLPGNAARVTMRWTDGAASFGYALGKDVRQLGGSGERVLRFTIGDVAPVPEPATWAMMIAGFGLVGAAMRRRRESLAG